ncbi:serine hydrolase domain-containing protein [Nocardioides stalactiti]|uniref:serine hydrolase domain-containing protein n=1 Tax=Nocardioides stalactiti TaxID=2755356 RepID=UPI001C80C676|nr:serine hydrolase domain-containing protein [Nocardioides stalactiti]
MRRVSVVLAALALTATVGSAGAAARTESTQRGEIDRYLDRAVPDGASGTLVAVRGREVICRGFGIVDREAGTAADCDTVYDIGSVTKQFTAAAIVKLQMMGRLDVDDRLGRWVGRSVPADKRPITARPLLTHTSGLVGSLGADDEPLTRRQLIEQALASPLRSRPGATYHYSNVGYSLLAVVVERASGMSYEQFLAEHLFAPAGMRSTGYVLPDWESRSVAVEYDARGRSHGRPIDQPWAADGPFWNLHGNGGILSSARDLVRWHHALIGDRVLDRPAKRALFRPRVLEEPGGDTRYGYGWVLIDTVVGRVAWHNGGNGRSYAELSRLLGQRTMVFWATSQVRSRDEWNLARVPLTSEVLRRLVR